MLAISLIVAVLVVTAVLSVCICYYTGNDEEEIPALVPISDYNMPLRVNQDSVAARVPDMEKNKETKLLAGQNSNSEIKTARTAGTGSQSQSNFDSIAALPTNKSSYYGK